MTNEELDAAVNDFVVNEDHQIIAFVDPSTKNVARISMVRSDPSGETIMRIRNAVKGLVAKVAGADTKEVVADPINQPRTVGHPIPVQTPPSNPSAAPTVAVAKPSTSV